MPKQAEGAFNDRVLLWVGVVSAGLYLGVLALSFQFRYGEGHEERPLLTVLMLFGFATAAWWYALWRITRSDQIEYLRPKTVIGFAILFRLILVGSSPIQEIDYYRYLWDGQVLSHGVNPFQYSPKQIEEAGAQRGTDLERLRRLSRRSEAVEILFSRVHHREVPTVYPPAAQAVFALAALVTPASAPLWVYVLVLKGFILAFDIATIFLLVALLRRLGLPTAWCLGYAWSPLVVKEFANSAHLDSIAVFFTTLALYLLVRLHGEESLGRRRLCLFAGVALGLGILAKSYPVVLVPVLAGYLLARVGWTSLWTGLVCLAVIVAGYAPFVALGSSDGTSHPWTGLGTFLGRWEMNDFLFMLTYENLRPPGEQPEHWFVIIPAAWRATLSDLLGASACGHRPAFLLAQVVLGSVLLGLCLRWAWMVYRDPRPQRLLACGFLTLAWGWLLSSAPNPWYLTWGLPLMVFDRRRSWWLLPGLAFVYYLRFWLEYRSPDEEAVRQARALFDFGVVWIEYMPFLLALLADSAWQAIRKKSEKVGPL